MIKRSSFTPLEPSSEIESNCSRAFNCSIFVPVKENKGEAFSIEVSEIPFSNISFFTPSSPILSSLSSATVKSINLSFAPITSAIPAKIFLLFSLIVTPSSFKSEKTASYNCTSSTSCKSEFDPTTSASH